MLEINVARWLSVNVGHKGTLHEDQTHRGKHRNPDVEKAKAFYGDVLGLEKLMDHGWIQTYGSEMKMTIQLSVASEGGSGTVVPDISIEVSDIDEALKRIAKAKIPIEYGPANEPWGVRRFYVRDPIGKLIKEWYDYENKWRTIALKNWCYANKIDLVG
jgi:predicted enzyme related to lactoylglutathione lyase